MMNILSDILDPIIFLERVYAACDHKMPHMRYMLYLGKTLTSRYHKVGKSASTFGWYSVVFRSKIRPKTCWVIGSLDHPWRQLRSCFGWSHQLSHVVWWRTSLIDGSCSSAPASNITWNGGDIYGWAPQKTLMEEWKTCCFISLHFEPFLVGKQYLKWWW